MSKKFLSKDDFKRLQEESDKKEAERLSNLTREEKERETMAALDYMAHHSNQFESPDQHIEAETNRIILNAISEDEKFTFFWATKSPFSQWHKCEFTAERCLRYSNTYPDEDNELKFSSAEQFMMYHKAMLCMDRETVTKVLATNDPKKQKVLGKSINMSEQDIRTWDYYKAEVVYLGNKAKFTQNEALKKALIATKGTTIVEAAPNDKIWGIGLAKDDLRAQNREAWQGKNLLGHILTRIRMEILNGY